MDERPTAKQPVLRRVLKATEERLSQLDLGYVVGFHIAQGSYSTGSPNNLRIITKDTLIDGYIEKYRLSTYSRRQALRLFEEALSSHEGKLPPAILGESDPHFWKYLLSVHFKKAPYEVLGKVIGLKQGSVTLAHMLDAKGVKRECYAGTTITHPTIEEVIFYSASKKE